VSCRLIVETADGRTLEATVDYPLGSIQRPLADDQLAAKFTDLATPSVGSERAAEIAAAVWAIDGATTVTRLVDLLVPADGER
jgi:2-methylcitrate dehydratase PrpD